MHRRQLLRLCTAAGLTGFPERRMNARQELVAATRALDHLLLGVADLDAGMAWIERITGVTPARGGSHPGRGTRNALVSLGERHYLEIIAPDPAQTDYRFPIDVRRLTQPRVINWAAASDDLDALAAKLRAEGVGMLGPTDGSRSRPDGTVLRWKTLAVASSFARDRVEPIPFFIQWTAGTIHPSQDAPKGCRLQSLEIAHPDYAGVAAILKQLGIDGGVKRADRAVLRATLDTPKEPVYLS